MTNSDSQSCDEEFEEALETLEPISRAGRQLANSAVAAAAADAGRTPEEQWERMGDHFAYMAVDQDPKQRQLDDYELDGETVVVER